MKTHIRKQNLMQNNCDSIVTSCLFLSQRSRRPSWAATSQQMTNTSWRALVTRRPPSTRSSTEQRLFASAFPLRGFFIFLADQTDYSGLTRTMRVKLQPADVCTGQRFTFFWPFVLWMHIFKSVIPPLLFGCNPVKQSFISEVLIPQASCVKCTYWIK